MANIYHYLSTSDAIQALTAMFATGVEWTAFTVGSTYYRCTQSNGDLHYFQTDPATTWIKKPQREIIEVCMGKAIRKPTTSNSSLPTLIGAFNTRWCEFPAVDYTYAAEDRLARANSVLGGNYVTSSTVMTRDENDQHTVYHYDTFTTYNQMGWYEFVCLPPGGDLAGTPIPLGDAAMNINVNVVNECDNSGIETALGDLVGAIADPDTGLAAIAGIAAIAIGTVGSPGTLVSKLVGITGIASSLADMYSAWQLGDIDGRLETMNNTLTQARLDLDGIESHVSHLGPMDTSILEHKEATRIAINNAASLLANHADGSVQELALIASRMLYQGPLGDQTLAEILHYIEQGAGGGGGGMDPEDLELVLDKYFLLDAGSEVWNLVEMIKSLLNTGWMVYKG